MANVKEVLIKGWMPYNGNPEVNFLAYNRVLSALGWMNLPSIGFRIRYNGEIDKIPSSHGGLLTRYGFVIHGEEACSVEQFRDFIKDIETLQGTVFEAKWRDVEEKTAWMNI